LRSSWLCCCGHESASLLATAVSIIYTCCSQSILPTLHDCASGQAARKHGVLEMQAEAWQTSHARAPAATHKQPAGNVAK
jgi:hypothetical protein